MLKRNDYFLIISFLTFIFFLILFVFRELDDNRLTSWQWVFNDIDVAGIYLILIAGVVIAYLLSRIAFPGRYPAIFLFSSSFLAASLFWKEPEVIVDASRYFTQAKHLEVYGLGYFVKEWGKTIMPWTDLPLVPFLYGLIFKFFGESRLYIQIFTTFLFSMTAVLTYLIGKELWDEDTGFYGGMLLLGIPYLFIQAPLMLVDVPTMFFLTLAIFSFIKLSAVGGMRMTIFSSISLCLAFYSKYSTWGMLSILVIIFIVYLRIASSSSHHSNPEPRSSSLLFTILTLSIASLLIGIIFLYKFDVYWDQMKLLMNYQRPALRRWGESFVSTFFFQVHPFITLASLYSVWTAIRKRDGRYAIISWLPLIVILFQVRRIRYIVPLFPLLTLTASYGLRQIRDREIKRFFVLSILLSSLTVAVFAYLPFTHKMSAENLKEAAKFLNMLNADDIEVFTLYHEKPDVNPAVSVPILDLYTCKRIHYSNGADYSPSQAEIRNSPLRFTWEYKNPAYYLTDNERKGYPAVVIISDETGGPVPSGVAKKIKGLRNSKTFNISDSVFRYKTFLTAYYN